MTTVLNQTIEAIWLADFNSSLHNHDTGIMVFDTKRCLGGNISFTFVGDYNITGKRFHAAIRIKKHNNAGKTFYKEDYILPLEGKYNDDSFEAIGTPYGNNNIIITVKFTRLEELT